jgi:hypothetical protein
MIKKTNLHKIMKTIKLNFLLVIMALGVFTFTSCEDEFTEEDFLDKQAELAATQHGYDLEKLMLEASLARENDSAQQALQQAIVDYQKAGNEEALAKAGLLLSYTVRIESDGKPVEGATISMSNATTGGRTMDAVSDASGNATITSGVPVGRNVIRFSGTGYYSMRGVVEFDPMGEDGDYAVVGNIIYPIGRNESSTLEVFSSDAGSVATVKGVVTIETDLTNGAAEIPQGLVISATFDVEADAEVSGTPIESLKFESSSIGSAAVDAETGAYTLMLPARLDGINYDLEYSTLTLDQKIAITYRDDDKLAAPEYAMVPTRFITDGEGGASDVVEVSGARIVFPAPPAAGLGLKASAFTVIPQSMPATSVNFAESDFYETGNYVYKLGTRGAVKQIPTMAITGGGATTNAQATATIKGYTTSVSITAAGTGYGDAQNVTVTVSMADASDAIIDNIFTVTVKSNADGTLPVSAINMLTADPSGSGFNSANPFEFDEDMTKLVATIGGTGTGATASVEYTGYLYGFDVTSAGQNLTSAPTITFTGGGTGATVPTVTVPFVYSEYEFTLDNSANTVAYSVLPADINFIITDDVENGLLESSTEDEIYSLVDDDEDYILDYVKVNNGQVVPEFLGDKFRIWSFTMPTMVVTPNTVETASAVAIINEDGQLEDIMITSYGEGYASPFTAEIVVPIEGAPGTGAAITLTDFYNSSDGSINWDGFWFISAPGSGYLQNLNQAFIEEGAKSFDADYWSVTLKPGDVIINNVDYGTGERLQNVAGEEEEEEVILD